MNNEEIIAMSRSGMAIEEIAEELGIDETAVMEALEDEFDKSLTMAGIEYISRMDLPPSWNESPFYPNQEIVANAYEQGNVDNHNDVWKDAEGDYLPDIDREVIVLIQDFPEDDEHLRVAYGHRPEPNGDAKTYGVGCWNI